MIIKIVTDSVADLPEDIAKRLDISIVPLCVQFGQETYRDGVEMTANDFYEKLIKDPRHPTTSTAPPEYFKQLWQRLLAEGADKVISIVVTSKLSAVYQAALQAKQMMSEKEKPKIEIIDSTTALMAEGFLAISAASLVESRKSAEEIVALVKKNIPHVHFLVILETIEYVKKGGRAVKALSRLKITPAFSKLVKPFLIVKDGEVHLGGLVRPHNRKNKILEYIEKFPGVKAIALEYSPGLEGKTEKIIEEIKKEVIAHFPSVPIYVSLVSPVIGTHMGPGAVGVSLIEAEP